MRSLAIGLSVIALTLSLVACSEDEKPSTPGTGGTGAGASGGSAGSGGHGGTGGQGGTSSTGGTGASGGSGGSAGTGGAGGQAGTGGQTGTGGTTGGTGGAGGSGPHGGPDGGPHETDSGSSMDGHGGGAEAGPPANKVEFAIAPLGANMANGTGMFEVMSGEMMIMVELKNCPAGRHPVQIHANPDCGMNGEAAGGLWGRGDNVGDVVCSAAGTGLLHATKMLGYWTIGGPQISNLLNHALVVHTGNARIACGVIK